MKHGANTVFIIPCCALTLTENSQSALEIKMLEGKQLNAFILFSLQDLIKATLWQGLIFYNKSQIKTLAHFSNHWYLSALRNFNLQVRLSGGHLYPEMGSIAGGDKNCLQLF